MMHRWRVLVSAALSFMIVASPGTGRQDVTVVGRVSVVDKGDKVASDVGQAVVWLESARTAPVADRTAQMIMADKEFQPRVVVVPVGSTVSFPNNDPFNHNVFSLSQEGPFDLGLYGRGDSRATVVPEAGILRVYCNVHARMSAFIVVRDNPYFARPNGDGSFEIRGVPTGRYTVHAWHERAQPFRQDVIVTRDGVAGLSIELDARGYRSETHLDKYGRPYTRRGRRY